MTLEEKQKQDEVREQKAADLKAKRRAVFGRNKDKGFRKPNECECEIPTPRPIMSIVNISGSYCEKCMGVLSFKVEGDDLTGAQRNRDSEEIQNQTYIPLIDELECADVTSVPDRVDQMELWLVRGRKMFSIVLTSTPEKVKAAVEGDTIRGKMVKIEYKKLNDARLPDNPKVVKVFSKP